MTQSIFITASNPYGYAVGSTQSVSDAVALQALGDATQQGGWGKLAQTVTQQLFTPQQLAGGALTPTQSSAVANAAVIAAAAPFAKFSLSTDVLRTGIGFVKAPSGTMGANGAITLGLAVGYTYASGIYLYLPAGAAYAGSVAGWYYTVMSSQTAGTVYNNIYVSGFPQVPSVPTPIVAAGPGAYTGSTGTILGPNVAVPGNALGANGELTFELFGFQYSGAGNKTVNPAFGGVLFSGYAISSNGVPCSGRWNIVNRGVANRQIFHDSYVGDGGYGAGAIGTASIDTTLPQVAGVYMSAAAFGADWVSVERITITVSPAA